MKKLLPLIISIIFIGLGSYLLKDNLMVLANGIQTTGKVIGLKANTDSDGDTTYCPKVQFKLTSGRTYTHQLTQCSNPPYKIGDSIPLIYIENNVQKVRINTTLWLYAFPGLFIGLGLIFLISIWKWQHN